MQCKWLQIFCLCAAIQFQFTEGYPDGPPSEIDATAGSQSYSAPELETNSSSVNNQQYPSHHNSDSGTDGNLGTKIVHPTHSVTYSNAPNKNKYKGLVNGRNNGGNNGQTISQRKSEDTNSSIQPITDTEINALNDGKKYSHAQEHRNIFMPSPKRYICTISTEHYDCQIQNVHLKNGQFYEFGLEHNPHQSLTFQDSTLEYLPKSLLDAFPNVTLLNLNDLMITSIEPKAFERAANLQTMYLENNRLTKVDRGAFQGAWKLKMLALSKNDITFLDNYAFDSNTDLQHFFLDQNQLDALPSFTHTAKLEFLNASHNNLASINDNHFRNQRNLKTLDVSFNRLERLNLQQLNADLDLVDVSSNALTDFIMPTNVVHLNAENNSLTEFVVGNRCTLVILILARNELKTQPMLENCRSLEHMDLSYNLLEAFSYQKSMANLQYLNLEHNNLFDISSPIKEFTRPFSLKVLDLSHNMLSYGPSLSVYKKLELVLLNDNYLISMKSYASKSRPDFIGYRMANNEWNCAEVPNFQSKTHDKNKDLCAAGMRNQSGICCRDYLKPYNDRFNEILRAADFHERTNKKKCSKPVSTISVQSNLDEIRNAIANANAEEAAKLKDIQEVRIKAFNNGKTLENLQANLNRLYNSKHNVAREIERQRQFHRVTREGLITDKEMLERIFKFVREKDAFNIALLKSRGEDTSKSNFLFDEKQQEINDLKESIAKLQAKHAALKIEEKDKKKLKDQLQRTANKNSASIHGTTGKIS